jgi:hypothetical protein
MPKAKLIDESELTPVEQVLADAQGSEHVICITLSSDGDIAVLTSIEYMPDVLWAMELAKMQVLDTSPSDEPEQ